LLYSYKSTNTDAKSAAVAFGLLTALITKHVLKNAYAHSEVTIMICLAYLAFIVADDLDLSGLMAGIEINNTSAN